MSAVPRSVRQRLVRLARHRCCLHRRFYIEQRPAFLQSDEVLDVHHVKFQACGGSNDENNLVPLCPTCHQGIHRRGLTINDDELLDMWSRWIKLRETVPPEIFIGDTSAMSPIQLEIDSYGLRSDVYVDPALPYGEFHDRLLAATIYILRTSDPFFPANRSATWSISSDTHATPGKWDAESAVVALSASEQPLRFWMNTAIAMSRKPTWRVGTRAPNRPL